MNLDRRGLLRISCAAVGSTLLSGSDLAAEEGPPAKFALGYSLYGMRSLDLFDALDACTRIGYGAVELAVMPDWPADPRGLSAGTRRKLREHLEMRHLELTALMENLSYEPGEAAQGVHRDRLKAAAELAHDLSPGRPPILETILGGKPGQWPDLRQKFVEAVGRWSEVAAQSQTVVCVKPHRSNAMDLPERAVWLIEQIRSPWIRLVYDYSHFQHRQLTMADTLAAMLPHVRFVHVKDTVIEDGAARFVLPGDGGVDYVELFSRLRDGGYRGTVCVEVSGMVQNRPGYDPLAAARRSFENLNNAFKTAR